MTVDTGRPAPATGTPTRDRLMEAAAGLLAERDDLSVSLREITAAARANVAAVNYHFGSKQALLDAVVARALAAHAEEQVAGLALVAAQPGAGVEEVVRAWLRPTLEVVEGRGSAMERVAARAVASRSPEVRALLVATHAEARARLTELLAARLPALPSGELAFRVEMAVSVGTGLLLRAPSEVATTARGRRGVTARRAVAFVVGGLCAPPAPAATQSGRRSRGATGGRAGAQERAQREPTDRA